MTETARLELLRALCRAIAPGGIEVIADEQRTAFAPESRTLMVARRFLSAETPVAIGALCHEVGHVLVTRYNLFVPPSDAPRTLWFQALNAVEETRVHGFLRTRLPGTQTYLDALFAVDDPPDVEELESEAVAFLAATAMWDRHPSLPFIAAFPGAAKAFRRTQTARLRYARTLPPGDLVPLPNLFDRYQTLVRHRLAAEASDGVVPLEAEVRCAAAAALNIFNGQIWPEVLSLAARDTSRIAWSLENDPELRDGAQHAIERGEERVARDLARRALRACTQDRGITVVPDMPADTPLHKLATELFRRYLEGLPPPEETRAARLSGSKDKLGDAGLRRTKARGAPAPEGTSSDEDWQCARTALVDVLRRAIPRQPSRWMSGYHSGAAVDLDRVMRVAATGRHTDRIWLRRSAELPQLAALLLVDLSGSMAGPKVAAAVTATRALSAALAEVRGISWCVLGFQDRVIPFIDFGERAGLGALARIDEMTAEVAGNRSGGNNQPRYNDDGPCLLQASARLEARHERHRLLMVISDGHPEGRHSGRDDLHTAVAKVQAAAGMTLVGLGLGPSTGHVTRYYPVSRANVALSDLAPALGQLLASGLRTAAR
ncbi:MAG TPA: hypothetical protein VKI44_33475 [Acetobacteraceae bacterium]|nr:hypothetical protein [Acetobacteraceae bacterium]